MENSVFDNLVDQDDIVKILKGTVSASRTNNHSQEMNHAWIFTGPPGSGRSSTAIAFAQALVCLSSGCGACSDCNAVRMRAHPDVEIVRSEGLSIKIDEVRELLTRVAWAPSMSGWRVVVMEDANRLTESSANALLKAIEESGTRTVWILCAPTLHDLIPTIRSRCRHLHLRAPSIEAVTKVLINRDKIEAGMADFAARVSQGRIGRAKYLASSDGARSTRKLIMELPTQLSTLAAAFQAAQNLVDLATQEAIKSTDTRDAREVEKLQEAYGKGATSRTTTAGGAKAVKELEKHQKARSTRTVRDSIDSALLEIATFYRDVMMVQLENPQSIINIDMLVEIETYSMKSTPQSIINKIVAIMEARESLTVNSAPLVTCEALMCRLARQ